MIWPSSLRACIWWSAQAHGVPLAEASSLGRHVKVHRARSRNNGPDAACDDGGARDRGADVHATARPPVTTGSFCRSSHEAIGHRQHGRLLATVVTRIGRSEMIMQLR